MMGFANAQPILARCPSELRWQHHHPEFVISQFTSYQAAARLVGREAGVFFGGGSSRSAGIWKRARNLCTMAMLSPFFPCRTSLTRLGLPRIGTISARLRTC